MEIFKCKHTVKCDFAGCNNLAEFSFSMKGLIKRDLCFCEECLKSMFECFSKMQIPKGIESPFKLNKRLKKNEK